MSMNSFLDKERLVELLVNKVSASKESLQEQWNNGNASVTRHFVIDNFIPDELCHLVYEDYMALKDNFIVGNFLFKQNKKTFTNLNDVSRQTKNLYSAFHDKRFVKVIEKIVNIKNLDPDPTLYAGGLTMMNQEDYLNPHIDNSHDRNRQKYRRINILFYITPEWSLENGGNLELWNSDVSKSHCVVSKFNRLVIMETNNISWHSVSPVKANASRCCLSTYYFTIQSPEDFDYFHVTSFQGRPEQRFLRSISKFDNSMRRLVSKVLNRGRR